MNDKSPEALLIAILDPNRAFETKYASFTIATVDGRVLNGLIASESATAVTLRRQDGKEDVLLRSADRGDDRLGPVADARGARKRPETPRPRRPDRLPGLEPARRANPSESTMPKPTDIRPVAVALYFLPIKTPGAAQVRPGGHDRGDLCARQDDGRGSPGAAGRRLGRDAALGPVGLAQPA